MLPGKPLRRWTLAASLAANVVLGLAAFGRPVPDDSVRPMPPAASADPALRHPGAADAIAGAKLERLLQLEQSALDEAAVAAADYWRSDGRYEIEYRAVLLDARDRVRDELLRVYGQDARIDPVFARVFRPLDPLYSFLSSAQQIALERLRFERDVRLAAAIDDGRGFAAALPGGAVGPAGSAGPGSVAGPAGEAARRAEQEYRRALAALLDDAARFELELRDSSIARQLRASGVALDEREFRESFRILAALEGGAGGIDAVLEAREALVDLLGGRRSASLWAARDPALARLEAVATAAGVAESALPLVHEVLAGFQQRRLLLARAAEASPDRAAGDSLALAGEEREALARIVGEEAAAAILRERAAESYRIFRGTSRRD